MPSRSSYSRNTSGRRLHRLAVTMAVAVVGLGSALAAPAALDALMADPGPEPIRSAPADQPEIGLVYSGLTPAKRGDPCVGGYQVAERGQCTHGPDAPPPGLDIRKDTPPVAPATAEPGTLRREETRGPSDEDVAGDDGTQRADGGLGLVAEAAPGAAAAVELGPHGVACDGDGVSGKRVQVLYVRAAGTASRFAQYLESFRTWSAGVDVIYNASAQETGGERHVRFVTTPDCRVAVQEVEVPAGGMDTFNATISALRNLGFNRTDRKYMIFGESRVYCGIGTFAGDTRPDAANRSNGGPGYGRTDAGCWNPGTAAHELGHNLGAVNNNAPNSSRAGHCLDEYDVMCYNDSGGLRTSVKCGDRAHDQRMDCNHDDYYHTNPSPGSYLATNWNVANSQFLINGGGTTPPPPSPTAAPSPSPSRSAGPSPTRSTGPSPTRSTGPSPTRSTGPSPTRSTGPSPTTPGPTGSPTTSPTPNPGLRELRVSDITPTSARLAWDPAAAGTRYAIVLNGRSIGQVAGVRVRIVGMRPDTEYRLAVSTVGAGGTLTPYTRTVTVRTTAARTPATGSWFVLSNALNGNVADVFGGRAAAGTPLVLYPAHGGANQQWKLESVADGRFQIRSRVSNLCLTTMQDRDLVGSPVVQQDCSTALSWTLQRTGFGTALTSPSGLVLGAGSQKYFGSRVLTLQRAGTAQHQSWTTRSP